MSWLNENPFLAGLGGVTLVGAGALGFLLFNSLTAYQETSDQYTAAVQKLQTLQNRVPFPSEENLKENKAQEEAYRSQLDALRASLAKMKLPLDPSIQPQQFQDNLRTAVNQTLEKATAAGVALPKDFYLGFSKYKDSPPTPQAAPALSRQLAIINQVVAGLIDVKVQSIDTLERAALPEEGAAKPDDKKPIIQRYPFDLAFTAEQSKFRVALNSLLGTEQYLVVRTVALQNTNPAGPPVSDASAATGSAPAATLGTPSTPAAPGSSDLNVILGREAVKAALKIEILDFTEPTEPKK